MRDTRYGFWEGVIILDKPSGPTSHDVVDAVRRKLAIRRVGHTGTLDPAASGVLVIMLGKATKLSRFLMSVEKSYTAALKLGFETDTMDIEGSVTARKTVPDCS
ncbi:MAG: tRNA pseudouridine(55) synthase, partial [Candidatus Aureabacteria bacterium]|nr:tRNA pseudouridine(55) synthase [Candidatus Auribacterota bacterium]